jgi:hypothetical protein
MTTSDFAHCSNQDAQSEPNWAEELLEIAQRVERRAAAKRGWERRRSSSLSPQEKNRV